MCTYPQVHRRVDRSCDESNIESTCAELTTESEASDDEQDEKSDSMNNESDNSKGSESASECLHHWKNQKCTPKSNKRKSENNSFSSGSDILNIVYQILVFTVYFHLKKQMLMKWIFI